MKKLFVGGWLFLILMIFLVGCSNEVVVKVDEEIVQDLIVEQPVVEESVAEPIESDELEEINVVETLDYNLIRPDESGEIMIVMYHNLSESNTTYSRTIESFKSDLQRLYDMGFSAVSMRDYIDGSFDIEAGRTPVVLTFDDGHRSNFNYLETDDGLEIEPESVVGILDAFYEENPTFGRAAIFYLNAGNPFGQPKYIEEKLKYLFDHGYEIGNHAYDHEDLTTLDAEGIQRALGKNMTHFNNLNENFFMDTLALPYGKIPQIDELKTYVVKGQYEGVEYSNHIVLRVGWKPYVPIYHMDFNQRGVHRVQSGDDDMQLSWWLDEYEKNPQRRFVSDGFANRISVPSLHLSRINVERISDKELVEYELEN